MRATNRSFRLVSAALVVLGNLLADLAVAWADPRVRVTNV